MMPFTRKKPVWGSLHPWALEQLRDRYPGKRLPVRKYLAVELGVSLSVLVKAIAAATPGERAAWTGGGE